MHHRTHCYARPHSPTLRGRLCVVCLQVEVAPLRLVTGTVLVRPSAVWIRYQAVFRSAPTQRMVITLLAYSWSLCGSQEYNVTVADPDLELKEGGWF